MTEQEYISLIVKELNNELSTSERKSLEAWIAADNVNKNIYLAFQKDWEKAADYKGNLNINKTNAWQKIESKISVEQETKVVSISNNKKWYKIAAVILVALATTFFVKDFVLNKGYVLEQTAQHETKTITLPDGSTVVLNENSSLKYKEIFSKREVSLKGEAFFEVTKDKDHPFTVSVSRTTTQVLGTSFNIDANKKGITEVALLTGKVKFSNTKNNSVLLSPGETAVYDNHTAIFSMIKSNNGNSISWKTNKLVFENTKLPEVVKNLSDHYKTEIAIVPSTQNTSCTFTGTFEDATISEVLEVISFSLNAEIALSNDIYSISSIDCK